jgi:hypothetical protein
MIIRHRGTSSLWLLTLLLVAASAQPDSECHLNIGDKMYDLSALSGEHTVSRTRQSPPTSMKDALRFNVCKQLSPLDGEDASEQVRVLAHPWIFFRTICIVFEWDVGLSEQGQHQARRFGSGYRCYSHGSGAGIAGGIY